MSGDRQDAVATAALPRARRLLPDHLRQHEAHVLAQHLELGDVLGPARAEEIDQALDELLRRARARGDADDAGALEPLLAHLELVVDQMRVGAGGARDVDEPVGVRRVARADHQHEVAALGHLLDGELAVRGGVADVVGARPGDRREALAQPGDDRAGLVDRERRLREVGDPLGIVDLERRRRPPRSPRARSSRAPRPSCPRPPRGRRGRRRRSCSPRRRT